MTDHDDRMLPGEVDAVDNLPENIRPFYHQHEDGKFRPRIAAGSGSWRFEDVGSLKSTLAKEREAARKAVARARELEESVSAYEGLDPAEAREALERLRSGKVTDSEQMAAREKALREQLGKKHHEELSRAQEQLQKLQQGIRREKVEAAGAVAASKLGIPSVLVSAHLREVGTVVEDADGNLVATVKGPDGEPRISMRENQTGFMTIEEYVTDILASDPEIREILPQRARGGAGGDRIGGGGRGRGGIAYDRSMPIEKRLAMAAKADAMRNGGRRA